MRLTPVKLGILTSVVAVVLPAQVGAVADGHAQPPTTGPAVPSTAAADADSYDVTLITGDVARLEVDENGTERATLVPSAGAEGYHAFTRGDDAYVVPAVAQPAVGADRVDLELFNVSGLVEQRLDDARSTTLPVIVAYQDVRGDGRAPATAEPPAGTTHTDELPSVDGLAATVDKSQTADFWGDTADAGESTQELNATAPGGVEKIWLDAQVSGTLDESAQQVGAPEAWNRGLTGHGSTIAVLDSGIDADHPDVQGRIVDSANFTGGDSTTDGAGHGTHVASIAAGSGAASDGRYRGIAPEASLMVGKVLGDDGTGTMSSAIAGMEWAAANGADVVNVSLGGPITRGDDPMSEAVNRLTADHDVLFVVAAGNYSPWNPGMEFVTSPASADSALAVGALQRADSLWGGSRRGRMDSDAIKPEIVAPGFGITAAGSSDAGDPPYTSKTGTSMAAPHIAGVAGLLKQQHPEWGAARLRDALTSTAQPLDPHYSVYEQGAGRVDAARATAQQVYVDASVLHLGYFARPFDDGELTVTRTLTYRNESAESVTLAVESELAADEGTASGLTVTPSALELAPGEDGEVTVVLDATELPSDTYSGAVTATAEGVDIRTAVGFYKQDDTVDVTLSAIDRNGDPGTATVRLVPYLEHDPRYYPEYIYLSPQQPEHTVRLPEGAYNLWSLVTTFDASGRYTEQESIVGDPKVDVRAPNSEITVDARDAVPVSVTTPRPSEPRTTAVSWWRGEPGTTLFHEETWSWSFNDGEPERVSMTPTEQVNDAPFGLTTSFDAGAPVLDVAAEGRRLDAVQVSGRLIDGHRRLRVADVGQATPDKINGQDLTGKVALIQESSRLGHSEQVDAAAQAGAEMVALYSAQPGVFWPSRVSGAVPVVAMPLGDGEKLREAAATHPIELDLSGTPRTPYAYDVSFDEEGAIPSKLDYRVKPSDLAEVETRIYSTGADERGWRLHQSAFDDCDCGSPAVADFVPSTGYTRTEYVTARPDITTFSAWQFLFGFPADILYSRDGRTYETGEKVTEEWLKAPLSPGVPQSEVRAGGRNPVSTRTGDRVYYSLAAMTDASGHWTPFFSPTTARSRLYLGDEQIYANNSALSGSVTVPSEPGTYRLEADVEHDGSRIGLSTRTHTEWTFGSARTDDGEALPLIDIDYGDVVDASSGRSVLDLANIAPAGERVRLDLTATHQNGSSASPVSDMSVQVSFDDGATWRDAHVASRGDGFSASYRHPGASGAEGYVSLRVEARDDDGGRIEQTLIRAYRVEGQ